MSVINILSPHVADLIAAGEVVERPASVIKELIENAFDAGAKNIVCEIRNGGMTYIRVTDDGCGMAPEDAGIAFTRHATSKLSDAGGLERISTMGFRGEALAAISSVSHIELVTKQKGAGEGTQVLLDAGDIQDMTSCGCPEGTTMIVRDLFFNTPARQKFMKTDRSEASACITTAMRCALGRPDVSLRFIRDGNDEFFSPGDGRIDSCLYALLGREETASMLQCVSSSEQIKIKGYLSSPADCRGNRTHQFFFVNGRFIKSQLLQTALEQAYRNQLLPGRYPSCALYLKIPFGTVDVNVHPAKTEVRFGSEKAVFDFVYHAAMFALEAEDRLTPAKSPVPEKKNDTVPLAPRDPVPSVFPVREETHEPVSKGNEPVTAPKETVPSLFSDHLSADFAVYETRTPSRSELVTKEDHICNHSDTIVQYIQDVQDHCSDTGFVPSAEKNVEKPVENVESLPVESCRILGEAFKTYIIVEQNGEIILIDKHAAHERMIFDRLKKNTGELVSQMLLIPETVHLSHAECELVEQNGALLTSLGFEIEEYGERTYIIRGVPADMIPGDAAAAIEEICEDLKSGIRPDPSSVRDEILHTVACKAAIKAGWDTQEPELKKLVDAVCSGEIRYCPHGRPVSAVITRTDLDKLFKRIV